MIRSKLWLIRYLTLQLFHEKHTHKRSGGKRKESTSGWHENVVWYDLTKKDYLIGLLGKWVEEIPVHEIWEFQLSCVTFSTVKVLSFGEKLPISGDKTALILSTILRGDRV